MKYYSVVVGEGGGYQVSSLSEAERLARVLHEKTGRSVRIFVHEPWVAPYVVEEYKGRPNPMKKRGRKFVPPYIVETWFERDKAYVGVFDSKENKVAEWWDEDVWAMFDSGFFKRGRGFEKSVLDYLASVGVIEEDY
jgi:hypothetical protein